MNDQDAPSAGHRKRRLAGAAGLLAAGALAGGIVAATLPASAASNTSTSTSSSQGQPSGPGARRLCGRGKRP